MSDNTTIDDKMQTALQRLLAGRATRTDGTLTVKNCQSPQTVETFVMVILLSGRARWGASRAAGGRPGLPVLPA